MAKKELPNTEILVHSDTLNKKKRLHSGNENNAKHQVAEILDEKYVGMQLILRLTGISANDINALRLRGVFQSAAPNKYPLYRSMRSILAHYRNEFNAVDPTQALKLEKVEGERAKTRKIQLGIARAEGSLVDANKTSELFTDTLRSIALFLNQLPDTLERIAAVEASKVERVRDEVDKIRAEIHDKISKNFELEKARSETGDTDDDGADD